MLWLLLACNTQDVTAEFKEREAAALAEPGAVPQDWQAEAALQLSPKLVQELLSASIESESKGMEPISLSVGTVKPVATLENLKFQGAGECEDCVAAKGRLEGHLKVKVGTLKREVPFIARFTADLRFETSRKGNARHVEMKLVDVQRLKFEFEDLPGVDLSGTLQKHGAALFESLEPVDLGSLGGPELHLRDARVVQESGGLRIELLTDAPEPAPITTWPAPPNSGWQAVVSEDALLAILRREAFTYGDVADGMEVYGEPVGLDLDGDRFELELRVWRLKGKGWWRDYTLSGALSVIEEGRHEQGQSPPTRLDLVAETVAEGRKSPGAGVVDPLALVGEGFLLKTLEDAAQASMPASDRFDVGAVTWHLKTQDARGHKDSLVLSGAVEVEKKKGR